MKELIKTVLITIVVAIGSYNFYGFTAIIQPVTKVAEYDSVSDRLRKGLEYLQCPRQRILSIADATKIAGDRTNISPMLIISLLYTESRFSYNSISPRGYVGIAQTPYASMIYPEVDIMHGAMILRDKLRLTDGNMIQALALYKGGNNPMAKRQAKEVIAVYHKVISYVG